MAVLRQDALAAALAALLLLAPGCNPDGAGDGTGDGTGSGGGAVQDDEGGGGSGGHVPACSPNEVELMVEQYGGVPTRLHIPVERGDTEAGSPLEAFLVDTGSALTFLFTGADAPRYEEAVATVGVGCESIVIPGRNFDPMPPVEGLPVTGILGADFFLAGVTVVDLQAPALMRWPPKTDLSEVGGQWSSTQTFDDVQGHMIAPVTLDGEPVRLMFDTGAPDLLWLGQPGQPGDVLVTATDAYGNTIELYLGEAELIMAGEAPRSVPVLRAPSFPSFEQTVATLGGDIHGLLGMSALAGRPFVVDGDARSLHLAPPP